jgi:hypothetical protein
MTMTGSTAPAIWVLLTGAGDVRMVSMTGPDSGRDVWKEVAERIPMRPGLRAYAARLRATTARTANPMAWLAKLDEVETETTHSQRVGERGLL